MREKSSCLGQADTKTIKTIKSSEPLIAIHDGLIFLDGIGCPH